MDDAFLTILRNRPVRRVRSLWLARAFAACVLVAVVAWVGYGLINYFTRSASFCNIPAQGPSASAAIDGYLRT